MTEWFRARVMEKLAKELTEEARDRIKTKNFALSARQSSTGEPAYPIHDRSHAANALARVRQYGTPKERAEVYKDVARKYPELAARSEVKAVRDRVEKDSCSSAKMAAMRTALDMQKLANLLTRIKSMANPMSHLGEHAYDVGGLGVLAVPVADKLQAMARARMAGESGDEAVRKRQFISEPVGEAMELGGLGILAAPGIGHLARGLRGGH